MSENKSEYPYAFVHDGETYRFKTAERMQMWKYIVTHGKNVTDEFIKSEEVKK